MAKINGAQPHDIIEPPSRVTAIAEDACRKIDGQIARHSPAVQAQILAELVARYIAGHRNPELSEGLLQAHVNAVRAQVHIRSGGNAA